MGSAFHNGIEMLGNGLGVEAACKAVNDMYALCPAHFDQYQWYYEEETVRRLVCAYDWKWSGHAIKYLEVEKQFELPLLNPKTGKKAQNFNLSGKIDAIVELEDGTLAVKETKLLGDDIGMDSSLWVRMRMDHQVTLYIYAARQLGFPVACVLYDVARKPTIKPTLIPVLDDDGLKVVVDAQGNRVMKKDGKPRLTASTEEGYILQTRPMSIEEWGEKLYADIAERPDYYFSRVEVARLDKDIEEYMYELWDIQQSLLDAQKKQAWYRTVSKDTCQYCDYFALCASGEMPTVAPDGFVILDNKHPELEKKHDEAAFIAAATTSNETTDDDTSGSYW